MLTEFLFCFGFLFAAAVDAYSTFPFDAIAFHLFVHELEVQLAAFTKRLCRNYVELLCVASCLLRLLWSSLILPIFFLLYSQSVSVSLPLTRSSTHVGNTLYTHIMHIFDQFKFLTAIAPSILPMII